MIDTAGWHATVSFAEIKKKNPQTKIFRSCCFGARKTTDLRRAAGRNSITTWKFPAILWPLQHVPRNESKCLALSSGDFLKREKKGEVKGSTTCYSVMQNGLQLKFSLFNLRKKINKGDWREKVFAFKEKNYYISLYSVHTIRE